ncbi:MAG TPA: PAS domain S-box protein [Tepidiformaceae bacterium]|nr:PAS domain S-box protein [Tepidiformaceae bacterium]
MAGRKAASAGTTQEPFAALLSALAAPAWVCDDATLQFAEVNAAAVALYGYTRTELLTMRLPEIEPTATVLPPAGRRECDHLARNGRLIEVEVRTEATTWGRRPARISVVTDLTSQRESERRVQSAESLVTSVVETAREAILTVDDELMITSMNPAACEMFRVERTAAVGRRLDRFIPAPYREEYGAQMIAQGITGGFAPPAALEMLLMRGDGDAFVGNASIARGESSGRPFIAIVLRDTTAQREAEAALRDSERRYHLLASVAPVGIFRLDSEGRCIYANERLGVMTGHTPESLHGLGWALVVHEDDRHAVLEEWSRALRERQPFHTEVRLLGTHGRCRWALISARAEEDEDGGIRSYVGTVIDISRRRAAEAALRESEALYHTLASIAPVGIFRMTTDGACTYSNDEAQAIAGRNAEGFTIADWTLWVHPRDRKRVTHVWLEASAKHEPFQQEFLLLRPDGSSLRVLTALVPETDDAGMMKGFLGTITDLSKIGKRGG